MNHDDLVDILKDSTAIRLLQVRNAPLVLSFLYQQFKVEHRTVIPHGILQEQLTDYLEFLQDTLPENPYSRPAEKYLEIWCREHGFLRRYYPDNSDELVYELTAEAERGLGWIADLQKREFVGTESRFLHIFDLLNNIVVLSTTDVPTRLAQLETDKAGIQAQIDEIKRTGRVEPHTPTAIKERFFDASEVARRLVADFREVEENFSAIARQVEEKQLESGTHKGRIIGHVLDADETLKESDQGRSFYSFWHFLTSPQKQSELQNLLDAVYGLREVQQIEDKSLRRLKRDLINAGKQIVQSNQRLGRRLRKLLEEQSLAEARRVSELVHEIKQLYMSRREQPPLETTLVTIEGEPDIDLVLARRLWQPSAQPSFAEQELQIAEADMEEADLAVLYQQFYVDKRQLYKRVEGLLEQQPEVTLAQLANRYPIEQGLTEILAYFSLATDSEVHHIQPEIEETIPFHDLQERRLQIVLPQVIFRRD